MSRQGTLLEAFCDRDDRIEVKTLDPELIKFFRQLETRHPSERWAVLIRAIGWFSKGYELHKLKVRVEAIMEIYKHLAPALSSRIAKGNCYGRKTEIDRFIFSCGVMIDKLTDDERKELVKAAEEHKDDSEIRRYIVDYTFRSNTGLDLLLRFAIRDEDRWLSILQQKAGKARKDNLAKRANNAK